MMKSKIKILRILFIFLFTVFFWNFSGKIWSQSLVSHIDTFNLKGNHIGFNIGLGLTHEIKDSSSTTRNKEHLAFNIGGNYLQMLRTWIGFHYKIQYKKFFLKAPDKVITLDYISGSMGFIWNIKNFIITIPGISFSVPLRERDKPNIGGLGMYAAIGYIVKINKELMMPIEAEADMLSAGNKFLIGIYLKFSFLWRL